MDLGVLLSLPVESIATRVMLAAVAAIVLVRLLLRVGLRSPRARVATALAPAAALVTLVLVALSTGTALRAPTLMLPAEGVQVLPVPILDGFMHFAPITAPLLVGGWVVVAGWRLRRRAVRTLRVRSAALRAVEQRLTGPAADRVERLVHRLAIDMAVSEPSVAVVPRCPGGAYVVGSSRPIMVVGADLVDQLDHDELEGVLAHELAHVRRRDNLVATTLGSLRDLAFFVPGGGWAVKQLHRERELAADQIAVQITQRPGALASGLLKVLEAGPARSNACAALVPSNGVVDRVRVLVTDHPAPSRMRRGSETVAVVAVVATATAAAFIVPTAIVGPQSERDAVALVWSAAGLPGEPAVVQTTEARAFTVYRRSQLEVGANQPRMVRTTLDEHSQENRRAALHACAAPDGSCPVPQRSVGLGLQPRPRITVDDALTSRWEATPVAGAEAAGGYGGLYWLARVQ